MLSRNSAQRVIIVQTARRAKERMLHCPPSHAAKKNGYPRAPIGNGENCAE